MLNDSFELEVTIESTTAIAAIDQVYDQLLSGGNNLQIILEAVTSEVQMQHSKQRLNGSDLMLPRSQRGQIAI